MLELVSELLSTHFKRQGASRASIAWKGPPSLNGWALCLWLLSSLWTSPIFAKRPLQFSIGTGLETIAITYPLSGGVYQAITIGGVPASAGMGTYVSNSLFFGGSYSLLLDLANDQISRTSLNAQMGLILLGGPPVYSLAFEDTIIISESTTALALLFELCSSSYSISTRNLVQQISGQSVEIRIGSSFRLGFSGIQFLTTAISLPSSSQRIQARSTELGIFILL